MGGYNIQYTFTGRKKLYEKMFDCRYKLIFLGNRDWRGGIARKNAITYFRFYINNLNYLQKKSHCYQLSYIPINKGLICL